MASVKYFPALQFVHVADPTLLHVPVLQTKQSSSALWSVASVAVASVKYLPALQFVHVVNPALLHVPAPQTVQAATFDALEYVPTVHWVHVVAPVPVPAFVLDPAPHVWQTVVDAES